MLQILRRDLEPYESDVVAFGCLDYTLPEEANYGSWDKPAPTSRYGPEYFGLWKKPGNASTSYSGDLILSFFRRQNAFTQTETIESETIQVRETISQLETQLVVPYRSILAKALLELFGYAIEENPDSVGISIGSLGSFFNFLQLYPTLKCPEVSLTPDNDIYASWRLAKDKLFSVKFLANNAVDWVAFGRNKLDPETIDRGSGNTVTSTLMQAVEPYDVASWVYDDRG